MYFQFFDNYAPYKLFIPKLGFELIDEDFKFLKLTKIDESKGKIYKNIKLLT